jgi:type IV secretory pathway TrbF-like protein
MKQRKVQGGTGDRNVYLDTRREWNERYGGYIAQARNWRLIAVGSLAVSAMSVGGLAWVAGQSKVSPYIVEVNGLGDAVPVAIADRAARPDARIIRAQLARWMNNCRTVYLDASAERQAIDQCYAMINRRGPAFQTATDYHRANEPFTRAQSESVTIQVETVLPISEDSWRVEWREEVRGRDGTVSSRTNWQAVVGITVIPPTDERQVLVNPMGVFVNSVSWSQRV